MAYGRPSNVRDNFGRTQRYATVNLTKYLQKKTEEIQVNVREVIAKELERTYKDNVSASYSPRGKGSYKHVGDIFLRSIHTEIEHEPGIGRDRVKIVFDEDKAYPATYTTDEEGRLIPQQKTVRDVYEYLTEGTAGGGYYYFQGSDGDLIRSYNYPTPPHNFEEHTKLDMKGFLEGLSLDVKNGKYSK